MIMKYVWFSLLNQRKWSVHGACWNVAWEHVRWIQWPHAGYRWFTGSDPDNANATWAFIDSLFSITRRGMSFDVHKVASHPLDVKHDTYIFFIAWICFCFIYQSIQFINEQFWFNNQGFITVFNNVLQTIDGDKSCHQSRVRFSFAKLTSISLTLETFNLLIRNMLWDLCVFWIGPSLKWGPAQSAS